MRLSKSLALRRPSRSARSGKRVRQAVFKPVLPPYGPHDEFDREDIDQLLLQAARLRANRAASE